MGTTTTYFDALAYGHRIRRSLAKSRRRRRRVAVVFIPAIRKRRRRLRHMYVNSISWAMLLLALVIMAAMPDHRAASAARVDRAALVP